MIRLTRFDGSVLLVNPDHVVMLEGSTDTFVCLTSGERLRVLESPDEVARRIDDAFRRRSAVAWLAEAEPVAPESGGS